MSKYVSSPIALQLYFNSGENGVIAPTVVDGITRRKVDLPQCTIRKCIEFIGTYSNPNGKGSSFARGKRTIKKDNQSDKMKMPYNTLQTERRNLYGV